MKTIEEQARAVHQLLKATYEKSPWSLEQVIADMQQDRTDYFMVYDQNHLIGFLAIQESIGEVEITHIAVLPSYQGQGVASQLMAHLDDLMGTIFLEVRASNTNAQGLYHKFGFELVGKRRAYYHDPIETALIMKREGKHDR
ncbi:ribosomal protein S18-alanine N-acetyltransferase [Streptococcus castoreus]|uniref:ribosomal protein S18-alanine N-acetyltransferase n=1 Tax=Streptococcus castoreus TaxID=254786 RepID=UPI0004265FDB|nr:ribosomal protein S18-alanine N-acetyltransferase [Streptococcus castoreus]